MTRKERLMATLNGRTVDRPPVCFYEINGYSENESDPDPFNIYNDPSWKPLLELARERTDRIVMCWVPFVHAPGELERRTSVTTYYDEKGSRHEITEIRADDRVLRKHTRQDQDVNTIWILEHLIKDEEDLEAWISLPDEELGIPDYRGILQTERELGDTGIVSVEIGDALCEVAGLMDMEEYMIIAMTEPELFHRALLKAQKKVYGMVSRIAADLPGRLWRIYGPEYAAPPYLPPHLYEEYVVGYDTVLVEAIRSNGGLARIHQHGRQKDILDYTVKTGCMALDPNEPEPQGDVSLTYMREHYGKQLVLFGNLEINDIEFMDTEAFGKKVEQALTEGTSGEGRGFVLMPSSCPLGRNLSERTLENYRKMVEVTEAFAERNMVEG